MQFDLDEPIDTIFNAIEDLAEIGELAGKPFTDPQLVDYCFVIAHRNRAFCTDIRDWMRKPEHKQTYVNFKTHFTESHVEL